jgi:hypothetical protein
MSKGFRRWIRLPVYILLMVLLPAAVFFWFPGSVPYSVTETYIFTSGGQAGRKVFLEVMLPHSGSYQEVGEITVDWDGTAERIGADGAEFDILRLAGETGSDGTARAVLSYAVEVAQGEVAWDAPVSERDLDPQPGIESDSPEMAGQAELLKGDTQRDTARSIFSFAADYISWPSESRESGDLSALDAYHSRIGGCSEFANLTVALARAAGVPARSVSGWFLPVWWPPLYAQTAVWNSPAGAHAWVEIYDGSRWTFADPSWASHFPWDSLWFGRTIGGHLSYGESGAAAAAYAEMEARGEQNGALIGGLSAPLKFVASARDESVTVEPSSTIRKGWDMHWIGAVAAYLVVVVSAILIERRTAENRHPGA